ncbi:unnamed protein product [Symbiodinium natans]|uniref:Uncharacterized protein n=1 Tax=Symbiodinium natans TaxID=878477 RepID=A0A812N2H4_9DINO|nr:unnamed protein product [Symbiodinium natans]
MNATTGPRGAQDTLVSQAFGAKDYDRARGYLNCCQVWMLLLAGACAVALYYTEAILLKIDAAGEETAVDTATHPWPAILTVC